MLERTVIKGWVTHPDPDVLVALFHGHHNYESIAESERAVERGELSELELEAVEEGMIERGEI